MDTFLFDSIIIGPIKSRRLGSSLGVNLLTPNAKLCNFDCIYCECGWNSSGVNRGAFNPADTVISALEERLSQLAVKGELPDVITFAGNGEPTMHPEFERIIDATLMLRNRYAPASRVAVLSNATMINREAVRNTLMKVDRNILKFDSAIDTTMRLINQPQNRRTVSQIVEVLQRFEGRLVIQTMLLRGSYDGQTVDNTTPREIEAYLVALRAISPSEVMLYTIDRNTPADELQKVSPDEMEVVAQQIRELDLGIAVSVAK